MFALSNASVLYMCGNLGAAGAHTCIYTDKYTELTK